MPCRIIENTVIKRVIGIFLKRGIIVYSIVTERREIADGFNTFFSSIAEKNEKVAFLVIVMKNN